MTAQFPDVLIRDDERLALYTNPLESYWDDDNPRPQFVSLNTACWRGYVATFQIVDQVLYLVGIEGSVLCDENGGLLTARGHYMDQPAFRRPEEVQSAKEVTLEMLFPGCTGKVRTSWFSGELRVPQGECLHYEHMGYSSIYERELLYSIQRGEVVDVRTIDNRYKPRKSLIDKLKEISPDTDDWLDREGESK